MIEALGLEVAAIRKKGGGTQVELRGGERVGEAEGSWLYRFIVAEDLNLRDDTPVRVTSGQEDVSGVLVSFRDGVLIVALEKDLGTKIATARIVEAHYRTGRSVLLVSNTNIAVDTALERVAERLKGEPEFHQGLVIRQGPVVKAELRQRFGQQVILEEIVARLGKALRHEKDHLIHEAAPLELPPIVMSDEPLAGEWLKRDVFEKAGIPERLQRGEPTPHLVPLGTQYRMREPICEIINSLFYADRPLRSDPCVSRGGGAFPFGTSPLLYVDTSLFHPWTALRVGSYSRYNLFHALLVRNIILHLAETGFLPPAGEANDAVGVVAPYASQARLIQALLEDRLGARAAGIAATVHRFQGNEKKAMVLDLTDSLGARLGRFLRASRIEEDGARLLNVAASRARYHVVLVGNFEYLRAKAPGDAIVRRLIDNFEAHGEALDLNTLLPLAERDWVDGLHRVMPASFDFPEGAAGAFTEGSFYPAFLQDLARAHESVVIFSPFATGPGTGRWVDPLRAALGRRVRVRILTRPPAEPGGGTTEEVGELVSALRDLGVTVDLRARMHEKIAILDGRILWHGSLNILSHRDTHESMLRIESPAACSQLARFISTPAGRRDDAPALDVRENPECPKCGGPTVWNDGRFGIYFECERPGCDGKTDARRNVRARATGGDGRGTGRRRPSGHGSGSTMGAGGRPCPKPGCGGRLAERNSRNGRFLGCTNYPGCRYTENLK